MSKLSERVVRFSRSRGAGRPDVWGIYEPDTGSIQYICADPATKKAALIDVVWNFDPKHYRTSSDNMEQVLALAEENGIEVEWVLIPTRMPTTRWSRRCSRRGPGRLRRSAQCERVVPTDAPGRVKDGLFARYGITAVFRHELTGAESEVTAPQLIVENGTVQMEVCQELRARSSNDGVTDLGLIGGTKTEEDTRHGLEGSIGLHRIGNAVASRDIYSAMYAAYRFCSRLQTGEHPVALTVGPARLGDNSPHRGLSLRNREFMRADRPSATRSTCSMTMSEDGRSP